MAISLIPYANSILLQFSAPHTFTSYYDGLEWDSYYIEQELDDSVLLGSNYVPSIQRFYFQINFGNNRTFSLTDDETVNITLYPCRPDAEYAVYRTAGISPLGTVRTLPEITEYHKEWSVCDDLLFNYALENAEKVREFLTNNGWSPEAIAGVLGLMYCQSGLNPANIGYKFSEPYSVSSRYITWCTRSTQASHGNLIIPYDNYEEPVLTNPHWEFGHYPTQGDPYWARIDKGRGSAISLTHGGFGLLGWFQFDKYLLFGQTENESFPHGNFWTGENQAQFIDFESRFNYYWDFPTITDSTLPVEYRIKTYQEYRIMTAEPETMAHIYLYHKERFLSLKDTYANVLECAKQWARYFYKPAVKKRKGMPIWEYLRYTI